MHAPRERDGGRRTFVSAIPEHRGQRVAFDQPSPKVDPALDACTYCTYQSTRHTSGSLRRARRPRCNWKRSVRMPSTCRHYPPRRYCRQPMPPTRPHPCSGTCHKRRTSRVIAFWGLDCVHLQHRNETLRARKASMLSGFSRREFRRTKKVPASVSSHTVLRCGLLY